MTYEQYWDGDSYLAVAYRKAFHLKRKLDNEQAWLQGLYIYDSFAVCLANLFSKRGAKKQNYFERPIDILPLSAEEKQRREQEEYDKMQKAMEAMVAKQRRNKPKKGGNNG